MNELNFIKEFQDLMENFLDLREFTNPIDKQNLTSKNYKKITGNA